MSMISPGPTPLAEKAEIKRTEMIVAVANMLFSPIYINATESSLCC